MIEWNPIILRQFSIRVTVTVLLLMALLLMALLLAPHARTDDPTKGDIFLGWMRHAAHVQIRFLNGGHTTYGRDTMLDITKELKAGLACSRKERE